MIKEELLFKKNHRMRKRYTKTWNKLLAKNTKHETHIPRKIIINKEYITDQKEITAEFNTVFKNIRPKLVSKNS